MMPSITEQNNYTNDLYSSKSIVQQRIERLYGNSTILRKTPPRKVDNAPPEENGNDVQNFPRVFRHLTPEFRHQLPLTTSRAGLRKSLDAIRSKTGGDEPDRAMRSNGTNGVRVSSIKVSASTKSSSHSVSIVQEETTQKTCREFRTEEVTLVKEASLQEINKNEEKRSERGLNGAAPEQPQSQHCPEIKSKPEEENVNVDLNKNVQMKSQPVNQVKDGQYFLKVINYL